jgi:transposase
MEVMAAPRKYPMSCVSGRSPSRSSWCRARRSKLDGARKPVGEQLGIVPNLLRNGVQQARVDAGAAPGPDPYERARLAELERENRELRRANAILKSASAVFAAALDRPFQR